MVVHKVPLKFYKGASFNETYTWKTGATAATALPVNLTGCTAKAQFRSKIGDPTILFELTTANGRIVLGGVNGTIQIKVADEDTALFAWTSAVYDLFIYFPDGTAIPRMTGSISVTQGVTVA